MYVVYAIPKSMGSNLLVNKYQIVRFRVLKNSEGYSVQRLLTRLVQYQLSAKQ